MNPLLKSSIFLLLPLLLTIKPCVHALANGCGNDSVAPGVNLFLYMTGEASLISCCNEHDLCYAKCVRQEDCDARLSTCLASICSGLRVGSFRKFACEKDTQAFNFFVEYFGNDFYVKGCEKHHGLVMMPSDVNSKPTIALAYDASMSSASTFSSLPLLSFLFSFKFLILVV
jgi:hypothetical protein